MNIEKFYKFIILPVVSFALYYLFIVIGIKPYDIIGTLASPYGSAMILLLLSHIFLENIFTRPKDSLANAVNALLILVIIFLQTNVDSINIWLILVTTLIVLCSSLIYLLVYEGKRKFIFLLMLSSKLGRAAFIFPFTAFLYFLKIDFNNQFLIQIDKIILLNFLFFLIPFLIISSYKFRHLFIRFLPFFKNVFQTESLGKVVGFQVPNIILVEFEENSGIEIENLVLISDTKVKDNKVTKRQENYLGLVLDFIESNTEKKIAVRIFLLNEPQKDITKESKFVVKLDSEVKRISKADELILNLTSEKIKYYWARKADIVGLVSFNSKINVLKGEIINHQTLANAELVTIINDPKSLIRYQIIEAETTRESQEDKKDYGYTRLIAYQLGEWRRPKKEDNTEDLTKLFQFFDYQWVPQNNTPIFKWNKKFDEINVDDPEVDKSEFYKLGNIPKTNFI